MLVQTAQWASVKSLAAIPLMPHFLIFAAIAILCHWIWLFGFRGKPHQKAYQAGGSPNHSFPIQEIDESILSKVDFVPFTPRPEPITGPELSNPSKAAGQQEVEETQGVSPQINAFEQERDVCESTLSSLSTITLPQERLKTVLKEEKTEVPINSLVKEYQGMSLENILEKLNDSNQREKISQLALLSQQTYDQYPLEAELSLLSSTHLRLLID